MRKILVAVLAGQLALAPAAAAADLAADGAASDQQPGAFFGARLRVAFGGEENGQLRAGLVAAPTLRSQAADGRISARLGEGLELGLRPDRPLTLSLAGRPLTGPDSGRPRAGVSTIAWIAIGTVVVAGAGLLWFVDAMNDSSE